MYAPKNANYVGVILYSEAELLGELRSDFLKNTTPFKRDWYNEFAVKVSKLILPDVKACVPYIWKDGNSVKYAAFWSSVVGEFSPEILKFVQYQFFGHAESDIQRIVG